MSKNNKINKKTNKIIKIKALDHFESTDVDCQKAIIYMIGEFVSEDEDYIVIKNQWMEFIKNDGNIDGTKVDLYHRILKKTILEVKEFEF